jgi:hypothetical protein
MKISSTLALAVIAAINAEVATARCFSWGWSFPDKAESREWVNHACRGNGGMFTGNFAPGQKKSMCPQTKYSGGMKVKFEVQNLNNNQGFDLGNDDCYNRLVSEINSCNWGGESTVSGWYFRWDSLLWCSIRSLLTTLTGPSRMDVKRFARL